MMAMRKQIGVYKYWYTPVLVRDHHVVFDNCPDEITDMLNYATEQSNEVKLE